MGLSPTMMWDVLTARLKNLDNQFDALNQRVIVGNKITVEVLAIISILKDKGIITNVEIIEAITAAKNTAAATKHDNQHDKHPEGAPISGVQPEDKCADEDHC